MEFTLHLSLSVLLIFSFSLLYFIESRVRWSIYTHSTGGGWTVGGSHRFICAMDTTYLFLYQYKKREKLTHRPTFEWVFRPAAYLLCAVVCTPDKWGKIKLLNSFLKKEKKRKKTLLYLANTRRRLYGSSIIGFSVVLPINIISGALLYVESIEIDGKLKWRWKMMMMFMTWDWLRSAIASFSLCK